MSGIASDGESWVSKALATIEELEKDAEHVSLLEDVGKEDQVIIALARQTTNALKQVPADQEEIAKGTEMLLLGSVLHRYCAEEDHDDAEVLEVRSVSDVFENFDVSFLLGLHRRHLSYVCIRKQKEQETPKGI
jgi:hypothetical protein